MIGKLTKKLRCRKCGTFWDKSWVDWRQAGCCPFCKSEPNTIRDEKASAVPWKKLNEEQKLQLRIAQAESRLVEMNCMRQKHENSPLFNSSAFIPSRQGAWYPGHAEQVYNHCRDVHELKHYQDEIVRTTLYISGLKSKLKIMTQQTPPNSVYITSQEVQPCVQ